MFINLPIDGHLDQRSIQELRERIDIRLRELTEEARKLRTQRNELSLISCLPLEVFSKIIRCYVVLPEPFTYPPGKGPWEHEHERHLKFREVYQGHLVISSICQSWRRAILGDHGLWTDIRAPYLKLTSELLKRSGTAPISLSLSYLNFLRTPAKQTHLQRTMDILSQQRPLMKYLSLDLPLAQDPPDFIWEPAPSMEYCEITGGSVSHPPRSLFNGSAPRLTKLLLVGVHEPWDLHLLYAIPNLQELTIAYVTSRPTMDQLLAILCPLNNLRRLALLDILPQEPGPSSNQMIIFPRVVDVYLMGSAAECMLFLGSATFQLYPSFRIVCCDEMQDRTYLLFEPWLREVWRSPEGLEAVAISSLVFRLGSIRDGETPFVRAYASGHPGCLDPPTISWEWAEEERGELVNMDFDFIRLVIQHLPLSECVRLDTSAAPDPEGWAVCCQRMARLETLELTSYHNHNLGDVTRALTISNDADARIPFPVLKRLWVEHRPREVEWNEFCIMLRNRSNKGYGVEFADIDES